ncbi:DUF6668 family protein [Streptomyces sp. NPDC017991]|uniref:DUF6668 family protein n=1 Tax=Streptomyces sp. NPDC017991 TaxID=3365026 RepID=UPI00379B07D2
MWVRGPTVRQAPTTAVQPAPGLPVTASVPAGPAETAARPFTAPSHRGQSPHVAWVNAHGGAGASTLAQRLGGVDMGRRWPDPARGEPSRMFLVARTHDAGMRAASQAVDLLRKKEHPAGVQLVGLVLVADAPGHLPPALGRRVRVLRSIADVHRLPWIPAWRLGRQLSQPPKQLQRIAHLVAEQPR